MADVEERKGGPAGIQGSSSNRLVNAMASKLSGLFKSTLSQHMENNLLEPKNNENRFDSGPQTFKNRSYLGTQKDEVLQSSSKKHAPQASKMPNLIEDRNERLEHLKLL